MTCKCPSTQMQKNCCFPITILLSCIFMSLLFQIFIHAHFQNFPAFLSPLQIAVCLTPDLTCAPQAFSVNRLKCSMLPLRLGHSCKTQSKIKFNCIFLSLSLSCNPPVNSSFTLIPLDSGVPSSKKNQIVLLWELASDQVVDKVWNRLNLR